MTGILDPWDYEFAKEAGTGWYRSKEPAPFDAFLGTGLLSNKKWPLQEERYDFNLYINGHISSIIAFSDYVITFNKDAAGKDWRKCRSTQTILM